MYSVFPLLNVTNDIANAAKPAAETSRSFGLPWLQGASSSASDGAALAKSAAITCMDMLDEMVYVGLLGGQVITYQFNKKEGSFTFIQSQSTIPQQVRIVQLHVLPGTQAVAVLADTILAFYDLSMHPLSIRPLKGITAIAVNQSAVENGPPVDQLVIARRRTLTQLQLKRAGSSLAISELKEIPLPDGAQRLVWRDNHVIVADARDYRLVRLADGQRLALAPFDQHSPNSPRQDFRPHMAFTSSSEVLVTCGRPDGPGLGLFFSTSGEPVRGTVQFPVYPKALVTLVRALHDDVDHLQVHHLLDLRAKQRDPLPLHATGFLTVPYGARMMHGCAVEILVRERDALYGLGCPPIVEQVRDALKAGQLDVALALAQAALPSDAHERFLAQASLGVRYLNACQLEDALTLFKKAGVPPKLVLHLYRPDAEQYRLAPDEADLLNSLGALSSFQTIVDLAVHKMYGSTDHLDAASVQGLRLTLQENMAHFLAEYLEWWRGSRDLVDPVIELGLLEVSLATKSPAKVLEQTQVICDLGLSADVLAYAEWRLQDAGEPHLYAQSLITQRAGNVRRTLDLWTRLVESGSPHVAITEVAQYLASQLGSPAELAEYAADLDWIAGRDAPLALAVVRRVVPRFDAHALAPASDTLTEMYLDDALRRTSPIADPMYYATVLTSLLARAMARCDAWDAEREYASVARTACVAFPVFLESRVSAATAQVAAGKGEVEESREAEATRARFQVLKLVEHAIPHDAQLGTLEEVLAGASDGDQSPRYRYERALLLERRGDVYGALRVMVREVRDLASASAVMDRHGVPFQSLVDEYLGMEDRDAYSSFFLSVAVKHLHAFDFDALVAVLPSQWGIQHAQPLLAHELARVAHVQRWSTMVRSLERHRFMAARAAALARAVGSDADSDLAPARTSVRLPTVCTRCRMPIVDATREFVVDPRGSVFHGNPCWRVNEEELKAAEEVVVEPPGTPPALSRRASARSLASAGTSAAAAGGARR
ncbi:hypothetical protein AMAG_13611 [Allomyces macrogynus ATCC 38327]|uniref:CNH domain-containing protein n=1 Tax=Allomyces macrogynus (strain ATCC 38327) TaxID=578462 RepID=A0A0L0T3C6_ALLM3|nr:hypothetical protein AMAG_13611 [Allomyces macrogynus ATCC 38327]|eukprot:KNE69221.1 hypothetical protein AMAG_13611 [Allomyces macrogynus ATCC 38327]